MTMSISAASPVQSHATEDAEINSFMLLLAVLLQGGIYSVRELSVVTLSAFALLLFSGIIACDFRLDRHRLLWQSWAFIYFT